MGEITISRIDPFMKRYKQHEQGKNIMFEPQSYNRESTMNRVGLNHKAANYTGTHKTKVVAGVPIRHGKLGSTPCSAEAQ